MPILSSRGAGSAKGFGLTTEVPRGPLGLVDFLVIAGGGGGGGAVGGGGGAGGYRTSAGTSGGGGSSGRVDYPAHMIAWHTMALDDSGADSLTDSVTSVMDSAIGASPWSTATPYDPDVDIAAWEAALTAFSAILAGITPTTNWASLLSQAASSITISNASVADMAGVTGITNAVIVADRDAFADSIDDEILTKVLPRFEGGMRNINAVLSSAFVIGASIIEGFRNREVAKHESGLRLMAAEKNAGIELEVGKANLSKNVSVAEMNLKKESALQGLRVEAAKQLMQIFLSNIKILPS
jgi:hypothetical protein